MFCTALVIASAFGMLLTTMTSPVLPTWMVREVLCAGSEADARAGAAAADDAADDAAGDAAAVAAATGAFEVCEAEAGAAGALVATGADALPLAAPFAAATA